VAGADLRGEPLIYRKAALARLLHRSRDGVQLVEHIEAANGVIVFEHACKLGLEGSCRSGATPSTDRAVRACG
jgi:bifunctional non-homologous end joining protein LigD